MTKAILVYGIISSFKWCENKRDKFFNTFGNDVDVFLSHDPDSESYKYIEEFKKLYSPVSVIDEAITEEDIYLPYVNKFLKSHRGPYYTKTVNMIKHYINKKRIVKLLKDHMKKTGKTYDFVCTARLDLCFNQNIPWETLEIMNNVLYIPDGNDHGGLNDRLCIGNFESIEKYASIYDNSIKLLDNGCDPFPEIILEAHVNDLGLDIKRFEYDSNLLRIDSDNTNTLPLILNNGPFEHYKTYYSKNHVCNILIDDYNDVVFRKIVPEDKYFSWFGYTIATGKWLLTFDIKSDIDIDFPFIKTHNPDIFHSVKDIKANTLTTISLELTIEKDTYLIFIFDQIKQLLNISFFDIVFTKIPIYTRVKNIHLVMYSNGEPFDTVKKLTLDSVYNYTTNNIIIHDYTLEKIKKRKWFIKIKNLPAIDKPGRRDGYYNAYKVFCCNEAYKLMKKDDILFYVDASQYYREGFTQSIDKLCDIAFEKGFIAGSIGNDLSNDYRSLCNKLNVWKKVLPDCNERILNQPHILNSWFLLKKSELNQTFLDSWIYWCMYSDIKFKDPLITEHLSGDQSIFNMLVHKFNLPVFYDKNRWHTLNKDKNGILKLVNESKNVHEFFITLPNYREL